MLGRPPSVAVPYRSAFPALCPCGHAASFRRRASSFVARPVCKPPERGARVPVCKAARGGHRQAAWAVVARCVRGTSSRSASAACGVRGVRAAQQRGSRQCDVR